MNSRVPMVTRTSPTIRLVFLSHSSFTVYEPQRSLSKLRRFVSVLFAGFRGQDQQPSQEQASPRKTGRFTRLNWWARPDSNRGPSGVSPGDCYEPAALSVFTLCEATWLSYGPAKKRAQTVRILNL